MPAARKRGAFNVTCHTRAAETAAREKQRHAGSRMQAAAAAFGNPTLCVWLLHGGRGCAGMRCGRMPVAQGLCASYIHVESTHVHVCASCTICTHTCVHAVLGCQCLSQGIHVYGLTCAWASMHIHGYRNCVSWSIQTSTVYRCCCDADAGVAAEPIWHVA